MNDRLIRRVKPEMTVVLLFDLCLLIIAVYARSWIDVDLHRFAGERAAQGRYKQLRGVRVVLGVLRAGETKHIAGIFDHSVLEPTTGAEEWPHVLTGVANAVQRALHAHIGAARRAPEGIVHLELTVCGTVQRFGWQPGDIHGEIERRSGVL